MGKKKIVYLLLTVRLDFGAFFVVLDACVSLPGPTCIVIDAPFVCSNIQWMSQIMRTNI